MSEMIDELKLKYEYIILDTPPVGLVSDALELSKFCDATIYVARQGFTKKGMLSVVNDKHKRGELNNISIFLIINNSKTQISLSTFRPNSFCFQIYLIQKFLFFSFLVSFEQNLLLKLKVN